TVSVHAASTARYRMGLRAGEQVPLMVLLEGVAIASANDAASALAEHLAGDEVTFVAWMNDKAHELGLAGTHFANPHGLPDPAQHSTSLDPKRLLRYGFLESGLDSPPEPKPRPTRRLPGRRAAAASASPASLQ